MRNEKVHNGNGTGCALLLCFDKIQFVALDKKRIAFGMTKAVYFKINIKVGPLNCLRT